MWKTTFKKFFSVHVWILYPIWRFVNSRYERVKTLTLRRDYFWVKRCSKTIIKNIYLVKFSNRSTRKRCEIYFKVNTNDTGMMSVTFMMSLLLILNIFHTCFSVAIVEFEQVNDFRTISQIPAQSDIKFTWKVPMDIVLMFLLVTLNSYLVTSYIFTPFYVAIILLKRNI